MFWKVDKHKRNDKNGIIHPFGKSTKKQRNDMDFPKPKIFHDSRKVYIDKHKHFGKQTNTSGMTRMG